MATGVAKTTSYSDTLLNVLRGSAVPTWGTALVALGTADFGEAGNPAGAEISGNGYARGTATFGAPADNSPNGRKVTTTTDITWGTASGNWGTIGYLALFPSGTALQGTANYYGAFGTAKIIQTNDQFKISAGGLTIGED